jgi:hypothetical protein
MTDEEAQRAAERMISCYRNSKYSPEERAADHAFSYDSTDPGRKFWLDVHNAIMRSRYWLRKTGESK